MNVAEALFVGFLFGAGFAGLLFGPGYLRYRDRARRAARLWHPAGSAVDGRRGAHWRV